MLSKCYAVLLKSGVLEVLFVLGEEVETLDESFVAEMIPAPSFEQPPWFLPCA